MRLGRMSGESRCPRCSSSNIIGYGGKYECFGCGFKRENRQPKHMKFLGKRITLPLWVIILIVAIATLAIAIPTTWYLFAQATITVKKGTATVTMTPVDIGSITIEAGDTWSYTVEFQVTIEGGTATIDGFIIGFDKSVEQLQNMFYHFGPTDFRFGNEPDNVNSIWDVRRLIQGGEVSSLWHQVTSEDGWTYYKYDGHYSLTPGTWYFKVHIDGTTQYPTEDLTANFKFYLDILT